MMGEVVVLATTVSLLCPLSLSRMEHPVISTDCGHINRPFCFNSLREMMHLDTNKVPTDYFTLLLYVPYDVQWNG